MKKNLVKLIAITVAAVMLLSIAGVVAERYIVSNTYRLPVVKSRPVETPAVVPAAADEVPAEEVAAEETVAEEPAAEEVAAEETVTEEPAADEVVAEEMAAEEPAAEEVAAEETVAEEPAAEEVVAEETVAEEPAAEEVFAEETVAEEPAAEEAAEEETEVQLPTPVVSISSNLTGETAVTVGTEMVLTVSVSGVDGYDYTIQWQQTTDGSTWTDLAGETGHQLRINLQLSHAGVYWRAVVQVIGPSAK